MSILPIKLSLQISSVNVTVVITKAISFGRNTLLPWLITGGPHSSPSGIRKKENEHSVDFQEDNAYVKPAVNGNKRLKMEGLGIILLDLWLHFSISEFPAPEA